MECRLNGGPVYPNPWSESLDPWPSPAATAGAYAVNEVVNHVKRFRKWPMGKGETQPSMSVLDELTLAPRTPRALSVLSASDLGNSENDAEAHL